MSSRCNTRTRTVLLLTLLGLLSHSAVARAQDLYVKHLAMGVTSYPDDWSFNEVLWRATVCNSGASTNKSFYVGVYLRQIWPPACWLGSDHRIKIDQGLKSGECKTVEYTALVRLVVAPNQAWAMADSECEVDETKEGNNVASQIYTSPPVKPDLRIKNLSAKTDGALVTYTVNVCNETVATQKPFDVELYYNRKNAPNCTTTPNQVVRLTSGLGAGKCKPFVFVRTGAPPGKYTAWARADANCEVLECHEMNNNKSVEYTVGANKPDLTLEWESTGSWGTAPGERRFYTTVCNEAASTSKTFDVGLYFNRTSPPTCGTTPNRTKSISGLNAGTCAEVEWKRTGILPGSRHAYFMADSGCVVSEVDESNNVEDEPWSSGPNLIVSPVIEVSTKGVTSTYAVSVVNYGDPVSQPFDLKMYIDPAAPPDCSTPADQTVRITSGLEGEYDHYVQRSFSHSYAVGGSHTVWFRADASCEVAESLETDNNNSVTHSVGKVDYVLKSLGVGVKDGNVGYVATICNQGASTKTGVDLGLTYDSSSAPTCGAAPDQVLTVPALQSGYCTVLTFLRQGAVQGDYKAWAMVDASCQLAEIDETNNTKSAGYSVGPIAPDLYIADLTAQTSGTTVTVQVELCNAGKAIPAGTAYDVALFYSGSEAPDCSDTPDDTLTLTAGLGNQACVTKSFTRTATPTGIYKGWVLLDASCQLSELDETNNSDFEVYSAGPVTQPDLYASTLKTWVSGSSVTYQARVCNVGATTGPHTVALYYDRATPPTCADTPDRSYSLSSFINGQCYSKLWLRNNAPAGVQTVWMLADQGCQVTEADEQNNTLSHTVEVVSTLPDLLVGSFAVVADTSGVAVDVTVCNGGQTASAASSLNLYTDFSGEPGCSDTPDVVLSVPSLAPGACDTQQSSLAAPVAGAHVAWALADGQCAQSEADETNNAYGLPYQLIAPSPDGGVPVDGGSPDAPVFDGGVATDGPLDGSISPADAVVSDGGGLDAALPDGGAGTPDGGPAMDAAADGSVMDAAVGDLAPADAPVGAADSSTTGDATATDSGIADSSVASDAAAPDSGTLDSGMADSLAVAGDGGADAASDEGCSCTAGGRAPTSPLTVLMMVLLLGLLGRRRR